LAKRRYRYRMRAIGAAARQLAPPMSTLVASPCNCNACHATLLASETTHDFKVQSWMHF
jgi:hypothetical protein